MKKSHSYFLEKAISLSQYSVDQGGFPAASIVIKNNKIIGSGISIGNIINDPTSHGDIAAIQSSCNKIQSTDLSEAILYTTMQPCMMCFSASMWASIKTIVYAIKKENVSTLYYGGDYDLSSLNKKILVPIQLIQIPELEEKALATVKSWEIKNH